MLIHNLVISKVSYQLAKNVFFFLSQDAAPFLSKGSSVIFISSVSAYSPGSLMGMYDVTKTTLLGLTKVKDYIFLITNFKIRNHFCISYASRRTTF